MYKMIHIKTSKVINDLNEVRNRLVTYEQTSFWGKTYCNTFGVEYAPFG